MRNKAGRPKKNPNDKVKFQKVSMHIPTYLKLKTYANNKNMHMVDILDDIIKKVV